jgi:hypothetical protein
VLAHVDMTDRAQQIVATSDRQSAITLLADLARTAEATGTSPTLPDPLADAVLATAFGALTDDHRQAVLAYTRSRVTLRDIVQWIESEPFAAADLLAIRRALDERLRRLHEDRIGPVPTFVSGSAK